MLDDERLQLYLKLGGTILVCLLMVYHYVATKPLPKTTAATSMMNKKL